MSIKTKFIPDLFYLEGYFSYSSRGFVVRKDYERAQDIKNLFMGYENEGYFYQVRHRYEVNDGCKITKKTNHSIEIKSMREIILGMAVMAFFALAIAVVAFANGKMNSSNRVRGNWSTG